MRVWVYPLTQWSDRAWRAQHRAAVMSGILAFGLVAACVWLLSGSWPTTNHGGPLDRDEAAYFAGVGSDADARERHMLSKGVRVIQPDIQVITQDDDEYGSREEYGPAYCPETFPVIGTTYGVYYLDTDEMFHEFESGDRIGLCFASEGAARSAGYIHGPVAPPLGQ